jgi:PAS domain S-box-containing protein
VIVTPDPNPPERTAASFDADALARAATTLAATVAHDVAVDSCVVATLGEDGVLEPIGTAGRLSEAEARDVAQCSLATAALHDLSVLATGVNSPMLRLTLPSLESLYATAAPLTVGGEGFGVVVALRAARRFDETETAVLAGLASLGSLAVSNARMLLGLQQRQREAATLTEIVQRFSASLELDQVVSAVAEHACKLLDGSGACVVISDVGSPTVAAAAGDARDHPELTAALASGLSATAVRARLPLCLSDLRTDPRWPPPPLPHAVRPNGIAAPMVIGARAIGALAVYGKARRDFSPQDEQLLVALASHAAIAVENARLFRAVDRAARRAETLLEAARSLTAAVEPQALFEELTRLAKVVVDADGVAMYSIDAGGRVVLVHAAGLATVGSRANVGLPVGASTRSWILRGQEEFLDNLPVDPASGTGGLQAESRIAARAQVPLVVEDRMSGALVVYWADSRTFASDERALLRDFGSLVAVALRNAGLVGDLEQRAERLSVLAGIRQVTSRPSLQEVFDDVRSAASTAVPAATTVALVTPTEDRYLQPQFVACGKLTSWRSMLPRVELSTCAVSRALRDRSTIQSSEPARTWAWSVPGLESSPAARSEIAAPLTNGDELIGALVVQSEREKAFAVEDAELLTLIARQSAAALAIARRFEAELRARTIAEASAEISHAALASTDPDDLCNAILAAVERAVRSDGNAIGVLSLDGSELVYRASHGSFSRLEGARFAAGQSAAGLVRNDGAVHIFQGGDALLAEGAMERAALVPLTAHGKLLGVLWSQLSAPSTGESTTIETLERLGEPISLAIDVLILNEAERKRRARERLLAGALATMDQPVFIAALDGRILFANTAAEREYGYSNDELTSLNLDALVGSTPPRLWAPDPSHAPTTREQVHQRKDGTRFPASLMISPLRDERQATAGMVVSARNLTEEQEIEAQLRQSEKLVALGELVAGVAHELNNPLAGISAFAQLMLEDQMIEEHVEAVQLIKREADRAVGVIRDLLAFARKTSPARALLDVNEMISLTMRLRAYSLRSAGVDVRLDLDQRSPKVLGDSQRLQQVLLNLLVNAEHALRKVNDRRLTVGTTLADGEAVITVSDTGCGMAEEIRQRIFEPFFTTKSAGEGTGLGLSVSYGIVQAHNGTISVASEPGTGTTFEIKLPASSAGPALQIA